MHRRIILKLLILFIGLILLVLLFLGRDIFTKEEIIKVNMNHVYILGIENSQITVLSKGTNLTYSLEEKMEIPSQTEGVANLEIWDGLVHSITFLNEKVTGRVLSIGGGSVGLEGTGTYPLYSGVKVFRLYGEKQIVPLNSVKIGSSLQDFVLEDGQVVAILVVGSEAMENIRVLLHTANYGGLLHEELEVTAQESFKVYYYDNGNLVENLYEAGEVYRVNKKQLEQKDGRIWIKTESNSGKVLLNSIVRSRELPEYSGVMECYLPKGSDDFYVINEVLLEEYLNGVVVSEMPASYPLEALKAQAVCARTYAYEKMQNAAYGSVGAHLDDSTNHQVYNNIETAQSVKQAVGETMGQVLFYEGNVAPVYYYSTSCGFGTDASIWGNGGDVPYLESKAFTGRPDEEFTKDSLTRNEVFHEFITTKSEADYEYGESYYRWFFKAKKISGEEIRGKIKSLCDAKDGKCYIKDKSDNFVLEDYRNLGTIENIWIAKRGSGGVAEQLIIDGSKNSAMVIGEYNIRKVLATDEGRLTLQNGSKKTGLTMLPSAFISLTAIVEDDEAVGYEIYGGGFGHGCGMSQNGAKAIANIGSECGIILETYFPACSVERIYE